MEEVDGIPGGLPMLALFPTPRARQSLPPEEWQACLDAWILCVEFRLRLRLEHFHHLRLSQSSSGFSFLSSYFLSWKLGGGSESSYQPGIAAEQNLHRHCLLLLRRLLHETATPYDCPARDFFAVLANASSAFSGSPYWMDTLQKAWHRQGKVILAAIEGTKAYLIEMMATGRSNGDEELEYSLKQVTALSKSLPQAGKAMMTGSDYVDSLASSYHALPGKLSAAESDDQRKVLTENLFYCLKSLMDPAKPSTSLLLDNLYGLKAKSEAEAKVNPNKPTLLSHLICSTPFIRILKTHIPTSSNSRGDPLLHFFLSYRTKMSYPHSITKPQASQLRKGKGKATSHLPSHEMHIHKAAQLSQIHELFPDTPTAFVLRLLDHFSDDVEAVTAALLEPESLPAGLQDAQESATPTNPEAISHAHVAPSSTPSPPPVRRNIFDGDDFDKLQISTSQIYIGHKEHDYDAPSDPSDNAKKKAAILMALAAFDSDDDERDDTYDVADVGGAVDNTVDTDYRPQGDKTKYQQVVDVNEQTLFKAWKTHPELFARDTNTRLAIHRQQLKSETGMSNEQIEGFAIMLSRNHVTIQDLEKKYFGPASFSSRQGALATTKWSANRSATASEEETDTDADGGGATGHLNRSGPFGGRGVPSTRGSTSGPARETSTQVSRRKKEQGRGRGGANHGRREGRARKMGRGFGGVPAG